MPPRAIACPSFAVIDLGLHTVGQHRDTYRVAQCNPMSHLAVIGLSLLTARQPSHRETCQVAQCDRTRQHVTEQVNLGSVNCARLRNATACDSMPQLNCDSAELSLARQLRHGGTCRIAQCNRMRQHATASL